MYIETASSPFPRSKFYVCLRFLYIKLKTFLCSANQSRLEYVWILWKIAKKKVYPGTWEPDFTIQDWKENSWCLPLPPTHNIMEPCGGGNIIRLLTTPPRKCHIVHCTSKCVSISTKAFGLFLGFQVLCIYFSVCIVCTYKRNLNTWDWDWLVVVYVLLQELFCMYLCTYILFNVYSIPFTTVPRSPTFNLS